MIATAANETKLAEKTKNNATKIANFKEKATAAQTELDTMMSNTTLVEACTAITAAKEATKSGNVHFTHDGIEILITPRFSKSCCLCIVLNCRCFLYFFHNQQCKLLECWDRTCFDHIFGGCWCCYIVGIATLKDIR